MGALSVQTRQLRNLLNTWSTPEFGWLDRLSEAEFARGVSRAAHLKRLEERWTADPAFKAQAAVSLEQAMLTYDLTLDSFDRPDSNQLADLPPTAADFRRLLHQRWNQVDQTLNLMTEPRFKAWRERQMARCAGQLKKFNHQSLIHAPVAFELSQGCSVGCWFCAMSAGRLEAVWAYTPANASLWRDVLKVVGETLGPAAGAGACFWATDPLDNPDYEQFCEDFYTILGMFPQTTTAQPLKDPARTRALLRLSLEKGSPLNRFSILSLKMLDRLHAEFSAEELALVDLVLQNKEGTGVVKFEAGRVRDHLKLNKAPTHRLTPGTSACVSGFLLNMVKRRVKLITPSPASDRWPSGYAILAEAGFANAQELKARMEMMIAAHMPSAPHPTDPVQFRPDLTYTPLPDYQGFRLSTAYQSHTFRGDASLAQVGEMIRGGDKTAAELEFLLEICGVPAAQTRRWLQQLFKQGLLADPSLSQQSLELVSIKEPDNSLVSLI